MKTLLNTSIYSLTQPSLLSSPLLISKGSYDIKKSVFNRQFSTILMNPYSLRSCLCVYSNILNPAIIRDTSLAADAGDLNIERSWFINITSTHSGSAIYDSSVGLFRLISSQFINCTSSEQGAAVYKSNGELFHARNCFRECYINFQANDILGNACYFEYLQGSYNFSVHVLCGVDMEQNGDTPVGITNSWTISAYNNFTQCFGYSGFLEIAYRLPLQGTKSMYQYIDKSGSHGILESWVNPVTYENLNIVNNTDIWYYFYFTSNTSLLKSCIFHNNLVIDLVRIPNTYMPILEDCIMYPVMPGFTAAQFPTLNTANSKQMPLCFVNTTHTFTYSLSYPSANPKILYLMSICVLEL